MKPTTVKAETLQLGDVIRLDLESFGDATVRRINEDGSRQVFRPFVHVGDFSYTGGVPVYTGFEDFAIYPKTTVTLLRRGEPFK